MLSDTPVRTGYVQALAGWEPSLGPYGRLEAGARLTQRWGAYAFGQVQLGGPVAGLGMRWEFDF